jgi:hypothetical protein
MRAAALVLVLAPLSCGRPATEAECEEIVGRIASLELKATQTVNPDDLDAEVRATQEAFRGQALDKCVGKRITQGALDCVRRATSARQIVEECFD